MIKVMHSREVFINLFPFKYIKLTCNIIMKFCISIDIDL